MLQVLESLGVMHSNVYNHFGSCEASMKDEERHKKELVAVIRAILVLSI